MRVLSKGCERRILMGRVDAAYLNLPKARYRKVCKKKGSIQTDRAEYLD